MQELEAGEKLKGSGLEAGWKRDGSGTEAEQSRRKRNGSGTEAGRKRNGSGTDGNGDCYGLIPGRLFISWRYEKKHARLIVDIGPSCWPKKTDITILRGQPRHMQNPHQENLKKKIQIISKSILTQEISEKTRTKQKTMKKTNNAKKTFKKHVFRITSVTSERRSYIELNKCEI